MDGDQLLVGSLSIGLAITAFVVALGPWHLPYRLYMPRTLTERYGLKTARLFYVGLGTVMMLIGIAILTGVRPSYALGFASA